MRKKRKTYSDDNKIKLIKEFQHRKISISEFTQEKNISQSTFKKWLEIYRIAETLKCSNKETLKTLDLIDITEETKEIVNESKINVEEKINVEINGITLTFALKNLRTVLEAIQNGWS